MAKPQLLDLSFYLVIKRTKQYRYSTGNLSVVKTTRTAPAIKANEIAIKINMKLPETLFERPQLQANINIDEKKVSPKIIEADVLENITEIVEQQLGIDLTINLVEPAEDEE